MSKYACRGGQPLSLFFQKERDSLKSEKVTSFFSHQGGVHLTKDPSKVPELVNAMIGHRLITKQTPKDGIPVSKVNLMDFVL